MSRFHVRHEIHRLLILLLCPAFPSVLQAQTQDVVPSVDIRAFSTNVMPDDYKVPVSSASLLRMGGRFRHDARPGDTRNYGSLSAYYLRYYDSLPFAWNLEVDSEGRIDGRSDRDAKDTYRIHLDSGIRRYLRPESNIFFSGDLNGRVLIDGWSNKGDQREMTFTPGVGFGRFITVTPLAQAVRIEAFLMEEGLISGPLPKETMVALAQLIERGREFHARFGDRYRVRWYEAMEAVIAASGLFVGDGLGAVGSLRVDEVLFRERVNHRFLGWDIRTGVRLRAWHDGPYRETLADRLEFSLLFRYSRPFAWRTQFELDASFNTPLLHGNRRQPIGDFRAGAFDARLELRYFYELTNRIDFTVANETNARRIIETYTPYTYTGRRDPEVIRRSRLTVTSELSSRFDFYVENRISFGISGAITVHRGSEPSRRVHRRVHMSIAYRIR